MKTLILMSDLHVDFHLEKGTGKFLITPETLLPQDVLQHPQNFIVCIAGDIDNKISRGLRWLKEFAMAYPALEIVFVLGNHDFYGEVFDTLPALVREWEKLNKIKNLHFIERSVFQIENMVFFGGTMWTNFLDEDPALVYGNAAQQINDFSYIFHQHYGNPISPSIMLEKHKRTVDFIFETSEKIVDDLVQVVITHHAPSFQSADARYLASDGDDFEIKENSRLMSGLYCTNLESKIVDSKIDLWHHGHMHIDKCYRVGNTTVICNPYGYHPSRNGEEFFPMELEFD